MITIYEDKMIKQGSLIEVVNKYRIIQVALFIDITLSIILPGIINVFDYIFKGKENTLNIWSLLVNLVFYSLIIVFILGILTLIVPYLRTRLYTYKYSITFDSEGVQITYENMIVNLIQHTELVVLYNYKDIENVDIDAKDIKINGKLSFIKNEVDNTYVRAKEEKEINEVCIPNVFSEENLLLKNMLIKGVGHYE